jgi:Phage P22-like portal protein
MPDYDDISQLDIPEQARRCWHDGIAAEREQREQFDERMRFRAGKQWKDEDVSARGKDRPAIVVNLLEQPIQQIINTNMRNRPGGKISPGDEAASDAVAEYLQGRVRHIEYESNAQYAYATCVGYMAAGGHGVVGLTIDYVAVDSLDQEPRIRAIEDPANWVLAPCREADGRDRRWAIGRCRYTTEEFKRLWPKAQIVDVSWYGEDQTYAEWGDGKDVWVAEYWRLDYKKRKLQRFSDGSEGFVDDPDFLRRLPPGATALPGKDNSVMKDCPVVMQYLCSGAEVLDETKWLGSRIPIYKGVPNSFFADGELVEKSAISDSLPSQQTYNCSESLKLESLVMAPKPKWLVSVEQIQGHEAAWKNANTSNDATLFYNGVVDSRGNPVPPPDWKVFVPPIQVFQAVSDGAKQDVKLETGFFDAALGNLDPGVVSGRAISALQQQTGMGTSHYAEALANLLKALYEDIIEVDRKLLGDKIRTRRVIKPDGKHDRMRINDPAALNPLLLNSGRYGVIVSIGPTQQNQREAASEFIDSVVQHDPEGWALIRDIGARIKEPDLGHYADEIATRWTPPQFAQQNEDLPPQAQQAMAQVQQLSQQNQQMQQVIQQKQVEEQGKYQRDMAVEQQKYATEELKAATQIRVAELNAKNDQLLAMMDARVKQLESASDRMAEMLKLGHAQAHEHAMTKVAHEHELAKLALPPQPNGVDTGATNSAPTPPTEG